MHPQSCLHELYFLGVSMTKKQVERRGNYFNCVTIPIEFTQTDMYIR